ncbi:MAG: hypothetical protein A2X64_06930 [Ignavibacteria bacterium GWF2_33_9]|nr:MAG: hypothetical protein A2X64_06930 [Ignavibacteria bacterium GWF2_33_9]
MKNLVLIFCFILSPYIILSQSDWVQTNGPFGGSMKFIGQDWNGYLFAISENNYLYRSKDSAENWERLSKEVSAIAFRKDSTYVLGSIYEEVFIYDRNFNFVKRIRDRHYKDYRSEIREICFDSNNAIIIRPESYASEMTLNNGEKWYRPTEFISMIDSNNWYYSFQHDSFLRSKDLGITWDTLIFNFVPRTYGSRFEVYNKVHNTFTIFFAENETFVFKETDTGWVANYNFFPIGYPGISFIEPNGDMYVINNELIGVSTDGGFTWKCKGNDCPYSINSIIKKGDFYYFSTSGFGIVKWDMNSNTSYLKNYGLNCTRTYSISKSKQGDIFMESDIGVFRTSNKGFSWEQLKIPGNTDNYNTIFCSKFGNIFVSNGTIYNLKGGILISSDNGQTWDTCFFDLGTRQTCIFAESDEGRIFAAGNELFYSDDFGKTWNKFYSFGDYISSLATYGDNYVLVGVGSSGVYFSEDKGISFRRLNIELSEMPRYDIVFNRKGDMFINMDGYMGGDAIYRSTDLGRTLKNVMPDSIGTVGFLRVDKEDNIYFSTYSYYTTKIYYSKDNGETWKKMNLGILDSMEINDIFFDDNQTAYICTQFDGVFRSDNFTSLDDKAIEVKKVNSVYPNPAEDYILIDSPSIKRGLGGVSEEIRIYDIFGNEMLTTPSSLRDDTPPKEGNLRIDVSSLPVGVYFVRIGDMLEKFVKI